MFLRKCDTMALMICVFMLTSIARAGCNNANGTVYTFTISEVISDQLPNIEVNKLPATKSSNNPMLMGCRESDDKAYLRVSMSYAPDNPAPSGSIYLGVRKVNTQTVLGSTQKASSGKTQISFTPESRAEYEVVAGFDSDNSTVLTDSEVCYVFAQKVRCIRQASYNIDKAYLNTGAQAMASTQPTASAFLNAFVTGLPPAGFSSWGASITPGELDHPVGVDWSVAQLCPEYGLSSLSYAYESFDLHDAVISDAMNRPEVINYLSIIDVVETSKWFGPWMYSGIVNFDDESDDIQRDMHNSFGHANVTCQYRINIKNRTGIVQQIEFISGTISDLYDFNYKLGGLSQRGATVQAGFSTLGDGGEVFKNQVGFSGTFTP